jgi:flagellar hook-basal body complex protein FliE
MKIEDIGNVGQSQLMHFNLNNSSNNSNKNLFESMLAEVNNGQKISEYETEQIATGKTENLQDSILKIDKASMALNLSLAVQNKLLSGFKEIVNTPV